MIDHEFAHCKDCCCARAWDALGVQEYTGLSIPEHITKLRAENAQYDATLTVAIEREDALRAERDALAAQLTGYDAAREMLNVQDNKIDTLRAVLDVARSCIYSLDAREIYADELDRIDAALAGKDAL